MKYLIAVLLFVSACSKVVAPVSPVVPVNPNGLKHATGFNYKPGQKGLMAGHPFGTPTITVQLAQKFSWLAAGFGTPVRDQGSCGSCYCFGSVQMMDGSLKIYGGQSMTLSEQQCVAYSGFDGCGGGDFAGDILVSGLVTDAKCPYEGNGAGCPGGKPTTFDAKATGWANLGDGTNPLTVAMIKQAIMQYGVIACDVAATVAWDNFTGPGLLSGQSNGINHIIAITGWDDTLGAWEMKNSWGTSFGNNGYAMVPYGDFSICQDAAYVQYSATPAFTMIRNQ